jgi:hypothetical protein
MAEDAVTKCLGLVTQYNPLSVKEGSLVQADNAVSRREDTIENRRGYKVYGEVANTPEQLLNYNQRVLTHGDTTIECDNGSGSFDAYSGSFQESYDIRVTGTTNSTTTISTLSSIAGIKLGQYVTGSGITAGTYVTDIAGTSITISVAATASASNVTLTFISRRIYFQEANSNVYVTTRDGVRVIEDVTPIKTTTATISSGTNQLSAIADTNYISVQKLITGTGIPAGTYVASIQSSTVTMTANASASTVGLTVTFTTRSREAGAPRALGPALSLVTGSAIADNKNIAYRTLLTRTDSNDNIIVGYPSERVWIANGSGSAKNVQLVNYLPSGARATDILEVYRTVQASGVTDTAGDEEGLVYQYTLQQSDIANGAVTVTDSVTDALIGQTIYTAPSQEGIAQGNEQPPLAKDIALFKDYMFYANTETKQVLYTNVISTTNMYNGGSYARTVIIAGITFTSAAAENIAAGQFQAYSTGVAATDIDNTARSLIRVINGYGTNTLTYAYYLTTPDTLPGQIQIVARTLGQAAFGIQVGTSATSNDFFPMPPVSPDTTSETTSSNQVKRNGLYVSKLQELEAVPLVNYYPVGPANSDLLRIIPLRDSMSLISENGIYRLSGDSIQSFNVTTVDLTVFCKAINTVAQLTNNVLMLSNQGVVAISDTGVEVISREIEDKIVKLLPFSNLSTFSVGFTYESERQYFLSTVTTENDTEPTQTFVFNIFTRAWTIWPFGIVTGIVEKFRDLLFFTFFDDTNVYQERKDFTNSDYADPEIAISITAISGDTVTFTISGATPEAGWVIEQGSSELKITDIELVGSAYVATMESTVPTSWTTGAAEIFPGIEMTIEWNAYTAGAPGYLKQLEMLKILADNITPNNTVSSLFMTFRTDLSSTKESVEVNSDASGWGSPWGSFPWGGVADTFAYPSWPPQAKSYFRVANFGVIHNNAREKCSLSGFSTTFNGVSERTNK